MKIAGLVRLSTVDFPGQLAAVVFAAGCDLDCFFCHNRPLIGNDAPDMPLTEVFAFLEKRRGMLDGVVISGGEPTLQPDLVSFLRLLRGMEYAIKIDTHGGHPQALEAVLNASPKPLADYVALDIKAPWARYPDITGCGPRIVEGVKETLSLLSRRSSLGTGSPGTFAWEVRTTVIPQLTEDDLVSMASSLPVVPLYVLQKYNRPAAFRPEDQFRVNVAAMTAERMEAAAVRMREYQPNVIVR